MPVLEDVITKSEGAADFSLSTDGSVVYVPASAMEQPAADDMTFVCVDRRGIEEAVEIESDDYAEFSLSPDGTQVAVAIDTSDLSEGTDVWVINLQDGARNRLTSGQTFNDRWPLWPPDGSRVAFDGPQLSWRAADGTGPIEPLAENDGTNRLPFAFTPVGESLVIRYARDLAVLSLVGLEIDNRSHCGATRG